MVVFITLSEIWLILLPNITGAIKCSFIILQSGQKGWFLKMTDFCRIFQKNYFKLSLFTKVERFFRRFTPPSTPLLLSTLFRPPGGTKFLKWLNVRLNIIRVATLAGKAGKAGKQYPFFQHLGGMAGKAGNSYPFNSPYLDVFVCFKYHHISTHHSHVIQVHSLSYVT